MPIVRRYVSTDGQEHGTVEEMRAREVVNDVDLALTATRDMIKHWVQGGTDSADIRDALRRTVVRIERARPDVVKRAPRVAAPGEAGPAPVPAPGQPVVAAGSMPPTNMESSEV